MTYRLIDYNVKILILQLLKQHTPRPLDAVRPELALQSQMIEQPDNIYRDRLQRHPGLHRIRARLPGYGLAHTAELTAAAYHPHRAR